MKPIGLKPAPKHAPKRLKSTEDLRTLQRLMIHALVRPLASGDRMQSKWIDGRSMARVAEEFIKPNDRLTAFERLELYNRQYWFRLLDCFYDDNPGLRAVLGDRKFMKLAEAYLTKYPSRSFSLRNLCSRLENFIREEPKWSRPYTDLALDLVRFEWAQIVAFDGATSPRLLPEELAGARPGRTRLGLQPYLTLLELNYAVDDYVLAVKKNGALRGDASNAFDSGPKVKKLKKLALPKKEKVCVGVHRLENALYCKRLEPDAFRVLAALRDGATVAKAVAAVLPATASVREQAAWSEKVQSWFKLWTELGWLCRRNAKA